jgi:hypothetical protein
VAWASVTPERANRAGASPCGPPPAITTRAHASGPRSSSTAMSKATVVTESTTSSDCSPGRARIERRKLTTAPCGTSTPLGRPVEPEV